MSNVESTQQPNTLEEAVEEIESLRSQLSGSDLKVFSQNRELRVENQKLKDEIRQLTEQCVTQTFKVRGLEKSEEKLQAAAKEAESKISDLESKLAELGKELEEFRSKEVQLSQELESTVRSNSEAMEKMLAQHSQEVEQKSAEFQAEIAGREQAIQELEQRVEQFKEEFLSQELTLDSNLGQAKTSGEAGAFEVLSQKMEAFLGFPGRALVEQVFRLSGVDPSSTSPSELEETFEVLQDTASQLVQDDEQEQELAALLKSAWSELGLGEAVKPSGEEPPAAAPEPEEVDNNIEPTIEEPPTESSEAPSEDSAEAVETTEPSESEESGDSSSQESEDTHAESDEVPDAPAVEESEPEKESEGSQSASEDTEQSLEPASAVEEPSSEPEVSAEESEQDVESDDQEVAAEDDASESLAETAAEEVADEPVAEEEPTPPAEPDAEPVAEEKQAEPPAEEEPTPPAEPDTEPVAEEEPAESAEVVSESQDPEEAVDAVDADAGSEALEPEEVAETEAETSQVEAAEESEPPESQEPTTEEGGSDAVGEVTADFDLAATYLEEGKHAEALPIFELLQKDDPEEPTHSVGRLACLAGMSRFQEALDLGKTLDGKDLGDSHEVFAESMEAAILGLAGKAESELVKKEYLLELLLRARPDDQVGHYLDEADEIPMRISREGELSLLQAKHRVSQDDVTEYLIDVLNSLHDRPTVFALLKTNLERYPELQPLSEFMQSLLDSPRAEALESESNVRELLGQGESVEDLLDETDPGEEAVVQVFLEHMLPRSGVECEIPSEEFEELMLDAEPAAFVGSLRQALRSVDYTAFFEEIEVLSYDGDEHFLLRSSPEPKPTLLFGEDLDDVPPEELRFLVLRELFSMYRRHSQLKHISAGLDDQKRVELVRACIDIFSEFESKVPEDTYQELEALKAAAQAEGQDADFRIRLEAFLREVYLATESDSFLELGDFLYNQQLNRKWLDPIADNFGAKQTGMVVASYAICRDVLEAEEFEELEEGGFGWLYSEDNLEKHSDLRLRLQRLWSSPLKALISEPEE